MTCFFMDQSPIELQLFYRGLAFFPSFVYNHFDDRKGM